MNLATRALALFLVLAAGCDTFSEQAKTMQPDINALLSGVTDQQSAEAAKGPLDAAVDQFRAALAEAQAQPPAAADEADDGSAEGGMVDGAVKAVMAQFGVTDETMTMITGLMQNDAVKAVLGGTLQELMSLIPAM